MSELQLTTAENWSNESDNFQHLDSIKKLNLLRKLTSQLTLNDLNLFMKELKVKYS